MTMRKRLSTIWLALFFLPYLCFSVIGDLPHQHGRYGVFQLSLQALHAAMPATGSAIAADPGSDGNDADHCSLCQVQATFSACASLGISPCATPLVATPCINTDHQLTPDALTGSSSSRAPPFSPS